MANYLNAYAPRSTIDLLIDLNSYELKNALNSICPARNNFGSYVSNQNAFSLGRMTSNHMDHLRASDIVKPKNNHIAALLADASDDFFPSYETEVPEHFSTWAAGFGDLASVAATNQNPSFDFISEAALFGFDYREFNKGLAGISFGYMHSYFYDAEHQGNGKINSAFLSFYGNALISDFYIEPALWGIFNKTKNTRHITFPDYSEDAHANIFNWQLVPHLGLGYDFDMPWGGGITPFTTFDCSINWQRGYTETGASPFNTLQKGKFSSMIRSETGFKLYETWAFNWGLLFLKEKISYIYEKPLGTNLTASITGIPSSFTVTAITQSVNLSSFGLELFATIGHDKPVGLSISYDGEFSKDYLANEVMLTISKSF